jgi:hypothetical protein
MQRRIEAQIRKTRRDKVAFEAAGLTEDATAANIKLRRLNQKYKEFSKAAGLPEQRDRMKVLYPDQSSEKYVQKAISIKNLKNEISEKPSTVLQTTVEVDSPLVKGIVPKGVEIGSLRIIAGGSSQTPVKVAKYLSETYGGEPLQWIKMGGIIKTDNFRYDVHWFELDGKHYEEKLKEVKKNEG